MYPFSDLDYPDFSLKKPAKSKFKTVKFGNNVLNLMPTNLYGPNDNFSEMNSHVIPGLIYRMHKASVDGDKEFKIWGSGKPLREFMHVDDLSYLLLLPHFRKEFILQFLTFKAHNNFDRLFFLSCPNLQYACVTNVTFTLI